MSVECGECERDLRGGHARDCSRWKLLVCPKCDRRVRDDDGLSFCPQHGVVDPVALVRADLSPALAVPEVAALVEAADRAIREAVADEMDPWFAQLRKALAALRGEGRG